MKYAGLAMTLAWTAGPAGAQTLADFAFVEGAWRGGNDALAFEEVWSAPAAGVMTGMARGWSGQSLRVLEYIVVEETEAGVFMRFKHFNADYSTWETDGPIVLRLVESKERDVLFRNDDPDAEVQSIRYFSTADRALQADVALLDDGAPAGFTLLFEKTAP